jgi:hypothetical protein
MNWEALSAVGELVGALAVVVTLAYLALQIRQNGRLLEQNGQLLASNLADSQRDSVNEVNRLLAADSEVARIHWAGLESRTQLEGAELKQFDALIALAFNHHQQVYIQTGNEAPGLAWLLAYPGVREWCSIHSHWMDSRWHEYLQSKITSE